MISDRDKTAIMDLASRYKVREVLLFGSGADPEKPARDIDLAVEGIAPEEFFSFYGDLIFRLSKPVDLVDMSKNTKFTIMVRREGVQLYDRRT